MPMDTGIVSGNSQNEVSASRINTRSKFNLSYHNFQTMRFGELTPHYVQEDVANDKNHQVRSKHDVRAYTLSAPLMSNIDIKKDYFAVPMECILPNTWPLIYTNPTIGDDVPEDANSVLSAYAFISAWKNYFNSLIEVLNDSKLDFSDEDDRKRYYNALLHLLIFGELIFSQGSLLSNLGYKLWSLFHISFSGNDYYFDDFDQFFDFCVDSLILPLSGGITISYNNSTAGDDLRKYSPDDGSNINRTFRMMIEDLRDNPVFEVYTLDYTAVLPYFDDFVLNITVPQEPVNGEGLYLNFARCAAYQIVCAHYYSNDHVDYIYSAELWRDMMWSLYFEALSSDGSTDLGFQFLSFPYNGRQIPYDAVSGVALNFTLLLLNDYFPCLSYWHHLLSFRHSLRFMDYFVGSKTQPLAVGDVNVAVNNGVANMLDITQKRWVMKYLNAVQKFGRKFSNYVEGLTGEKPAPDYHNPFWIGHTTDTIYGQEVENTGEAQMSKDVPVPVTANLRSNADRYAFQFDADRPCIIIGITYFDVPRSYFAGIERLVQHKDRFDMFNPYMQFLGDQEVYGSELFASRDSVFGYQGRYEEYKQRYNIASGGFVKTLPGWTFLNDWNLINLSGSPVTPVVPISDHIGPSFIRSKSYELDRYYKSLTGFSLGSYFHFIVDTYNDVSISRPMAFNPSID